VCADAALGPVRLVLHRVLVEGVRAGRYRWSRDVLADGDASGTALIDRLTVDDREGPQPVRAVRGRASECSRLDGPRWPATADPR
jgi:hypothetical protein